MAWHEKHRASAPEMGDLAPDFELYDVAGETSVRLSSFRGDTPVALVFGSFT
jgi:peroxiredoxin